MSGWLLPVDKPEGPTSFDVVALARRASGERRVGHTGTLDPFASGLLLVLGGPATKLCPFLLDEEKEYDGVLLLGRRTDSGDPTGRVIDERALPPGLTLDDLRRAASRFVGRIRQAAPAFSAVKVGGERLYHRARRGLEVKAPEREIDVHAFEILAYDPPRVSFRVRCGRGAYIRRLAEDLGEALGSCASLEALRRTRIGRFTAAEAIRAGDLRAISRADLAARRLPAGDALAGWPSGRLDAEGTRRVRHGLAIERDAVGGRGPDEGRLVLLGPDGALVAVAEAGAGGTIRPIRVF
jgi:tRNA pseudouridine55 synthase